MRKLEKIKQITSMAGNPAKLTPAEKEYLKQRESPDCPPYLILYNDDNTEVRKLQLSIAKKCNSKIIYINEP